MAEISTLVFLEHAALTVCAVDNYAIFQHNTILQHFSAPTVVINPPHAAPDPLHLHLCAAHATKRSRLLGLGATLLQGREPDAAV
jgi:hypothetical protein